MKKLLICCLFLIIYYTIPFNINAEKVSLDTGLEIDNIINDKTKIKSGRYETYYDFKTSYFDNLTTNFGVNYKGSCGYVAMASLLSYYDTYFDDDIIPEKYDVNSLGYETNMVTRANSPGVFRDTIAGLTGDNNYGFGVDSSEYFTEVLKKENYSLHSRLISLGELAGFYDYESDISPAGTNFYSRKIVLEHYFKSIKYTNYNILSINREADTSKSEEVRNFVINQIELGNPVLLSVSNENGEGHVVVAYDYDSYSDSIYCHMGWHSYGATSAMVENYGYTIYKTALVIQFEGEHMHTNNYAVLKEDNNASDTKFYCFDDKNIFVFTHIHNYETYVCMDDKKHYSYCESCNEKNIQPHIISSGSINKGNLFAICLVCKGRASIGFISTLSLYENNFIQIFNGSYILPNGVYVLSKQDEVDFLLGKLKIFEEMGDL